MEQSLPPTPPTPPTTPPPQPLSQSDERTYAMLAHFSVLLNLVTGFAGVIAPLVIYLVYKERSRYVAYHAMQSFVFQIVTWVGGIVIIVGSAIGSAIPFVGLVCVPITCLAVFLPLVPIVYGIVGGIKCNNGEDFKYWLVGDWVRSTLTG